MYDNNSVTLPDFAINVNKPAPPRRAEGKDGFSAGTRKKPFQEYHEWSMSFPVRATVFSGA
ncbi:hypothetical protein KL86DPRO_11720 [uncultured delta proteobacterium]|uniref:Uncharacterized protein n=1 Tax=uncultured delta proteobacterium TaxID=34034 RepID=A0A212JKW4_9DELT|nr:hypothetical protein KL86DPRO_11720 [uncultured delta proteobacterium]